MKNNVIGIVEFHKRYDEANLYTKKIIQDKLLGEILYYHVDYSQRISIPRDTFKSWVEHTNIFQYLGVHYIDLVYFVTKATPMRVLAMGQKNWLKKKKINTFDSIQCFIE